MMPSTMCHSTFMNLDCEIHYWQRPGSGKNHILFFHGAGVDHNMFESQIDIFDDSYTLTLWDARGHGLSKLHGGKSFVFNDMVSDCIKLYEILGISKAILIGQSMGGNLAQEISYRHPEMVEKMVLIDCTRNTGKLTFVDKLMLKLTKPTFYCYPWNTLINQSAVACSNKEDVRQYVKDCFRKIDKATFIEIIISLTKCLHEDTEYRFKQPVLLLCGTDDKSGNIKKIVKPWADTDNSCILHMIERAGHNSNQDEPDVVNKHIIDFVYGAL